MSKFANLMNVIPGRVRIIGFLAAVLLGVLACTPADAQFLQGIFQDVDSANGEITIVTKDGKTITLTISTDAPVDTDGAASSFEALEPGVSIEVNVADDGEYATEISARQTKAKGSVVSVGGNQVSIQTGDGSIVVVTVDETTRIELEEDLPASLADISVGVDIEVKFDPETGVAFKLDFDREEVEIEGLVVNVDDDQVTIKTEHGRVLTVTVGENARIELDDDWPATIDDIVNGLTIEVDFDPSSLAAFKIEIDRDEVEIDGLVVNVDDDQVTIQTEDDRELKVTVGENTRIELADDSQGTLADILAGLKIEVDFDPSTLAAFKIEIEHDEHQQEDTEDGKS